MTRFQNNKGIKKSYSFLEDLELALMNPAARASFFEQVEITHRTKEEIPSDDKQTWISME